MKIVKGRLGVCGLIVALASVSVSSAVAAQEDDGSQVEDVSEALSAATSADSLANVVTTSQGEAIVANDGGSIVEIPVDPAAGVDLVSATGVQVSIDLPGGARADDAVVTDQATVVYTDALPAASIAVQALDDGGLRALVAIEGPSAPTEYRFPFDMPDNGRLELEPDGSVAVLDAGGIPLGTVSRPWAHDAGGRDVPTFYSLDGATIVQHVSHEGFEYPVVADPEWSWGWVSGTIYFTRAETRNMRDAAAVASFAAGSCLWIAWTGLGAAVCAALGISSFQIAIVATRAYEDGGCLKIKGPFPTYGETQRYGRRGCR